ncbi:demethylmenaquinone methyltransferase-like [Paramacrobiotus metropolitanus]|uniref:demethylmenaquinone methyltransferase-like n=1 Tax=Paramacrobiotus metropolitanus TaxID=2943436 RepID=UPI00244568BB|nr:demethylmenaquinone methyltransferase-like [Paramacrobiotus metropolitanus]XP_055338107.1 demethylmenaquinone methyltransferase-like [Paramacrobiotus metropolitanus]
MACTRDSTAEDKGSIEYFDKLTKQHEETGYLRKTSNNTGWQMNVLDEFGERFIQYAKACQKPVILDLGVAYGYTSKQLLEAGASVVANELSAEMLDDLLSNVSEEEKGRLQLKPGSALDLDFPAESFDGILASRCFQFFKPDEMRSMLARFAKWLRPGGKLCLTVSSPYLCKAIPFLDEYNRRRAAGVEFPGYFETAELETILEGLKHMHFVDLDVLKREVERAGFVVEKLAYIARPYAANNGKEGVGVICSKPKL